MPLHEIDRAIGRYRDFLLPPLFSFILCAPALLYSGESWFNSPFALKWIGAFVPMGYIAGCWGVSLMKNEQGFSIDAPGFSLLTLLFLLFLQPLLIALPNYYEWFRQFLFISSLIGCYFVFRDLRQDAWFSFILEAMLIMALMSIFIAIAQQQEWSAKFPFVMSHPLRDRFLANTGLDGILGTLLSFSVVSALWLLFFSEEERTRRFSIVKRVLHLLALAILLWGLWKTGARSSLLGALAGLALLLFVFRTYRSKSSLLKSSFFLTVVLLLVLSIVAGICFFPKAFLVARRDLTASYSIDAFNPAKEGRFAIWALTIEMIKNAPMLGVGIGQYKSRFLETLPFFYQKYDIEPRYSYWAHSEYLQCVAEMGIPVAIFCCAGFCFWIRRIAKAHEKRSLPPSAWWGLSILAVVLVDALFSRPLHHVETAIWIPFALAQANHGVFPPIALSSSFRRLIGCVTLFVAAGGIFVLVQAIPWEKEMGQAKHNLPFLFILKKDGVQQRDAPFFLGDGAIMLFGKETAIWARQIGTQEAFALAAERMSRSFELQPMFEDLPELMQLYLAAGKQDKAWELMKYLPPSVLKEWRNILGSSDVMR